MSDQKLEGILLTLYEVSHLVQNSQNPLSDLHQKYQGMFPTQFGEAFLEFCLKNEDLWNRIKDYFVNMINKRKMAKEYWEVVDAVKEYMEPILNHFIYKFKEYLNELTKKPISEEHKLVIYTIMEALEKEGDKVKNTLKSLLINYFPNVLWDENNLYEFKRKLENKKGKE